jgi:N-acetylmuramoyl-L-alanine amidase
MKKPRLTALGGESLPDGKSMRAFYQGMETDVLARTLWGEARGEGEDGMRAVACVVLNRALHAEANGRFWWGSDIIQICQKPYQFSCWNRADPNFRKLQAVDQSDLAFAAALAIARQALAGGLEDMTDGATHYHARDITPYWARGETPCAVIGNHIFYRII